MQTKKKLGELLVEANLITPQDYKQALLSIKGNKLKLGQYLVRHNYVAEDKLVDVVSKQLGIEKYLLMLWLLMILKHFPVLKRNR